MKVKFKDKPGNLPFWRDVILYVTHVGESLYTVYSEQTLNFSYHTLFPRNSFYVYKADVEIIEEGADDNILEGF